MAAPSPVRQLGRRTEIYELDEWGERTPRTKIVAIGSQIDARDLTSKFDSCTRQS